MKAAVFDEYGLAEVLRLEEVQKPIPKDDELLIQVIATSINDWDRALLRGTPFVNRFSSGLIKPTKIRIVGVDVAGIVKAVGKRVTRFQVGDPVFGDLSACGFGSYAEFVCAKETSLTLKPDTMTYEQAACLPHSGNLAMQGLQYQGLIREGQKVLINGAGGGAGTIAIQLAKALGAEVTAVDKAVKLDLMKKMGADFVIDYQAEDFTKNGQQYDKIIDCMAFYSAQDYHGSLANNGVYGMLGGATSRIMQIMFFAPLLGLVSTKKLGLIILKANQDQGKLVELFEAGTFSPVIDQVFHLDQAPEAMAYYASGEAKGKVIISMGQAGA